MKIRWGIALSLLLLASLTPVSYAGYIGDEAGLDLYKKINSGSSAMKISMISMRLKDGQFSKNIKDELGKVCKSKTGNTRGDCISDKEFSIPELESIKTGDLSAIKSRLKEGNQADTDLLEQLHAKIMSRYNVLLAEVSSEQDRLEKMGSLGIYTDGNTENSSFDLITDIAAINDIIFSKGLSYPGTANTSKSALDDLLAGIDPSTDSGYGSSYDPDALWYLPKELREKLAPKSPTFNSEVANAGISPLSPAIVASFNSPICSTGSIAWMDGVDPGLLADIADQLQNGSNNATQSNSPRGNSGTGSTASGPTFGNFGGDDTTGASFGWNGAIQGSKKDTFPCTGFICIIFSAVMEDSSLLGGGKSYAIETVLDKHLKIVKSFQDSSFEQHRMTSEFAEYSGKKLNLANMVHLGVYVTYRAAPILNLDPSQTPRGGAAEGKDVQEFREIEWQVYKEFGIEPGRENSLEMNDESHVLRNIQWLSSSEVSQKIQIVGSARTSYTDAKEREIMNRYTDTFSSDILELQAFSKSFVNITENLASLAKQYYNIPNGGQ